MRGTRLKQAPYNVCEHYPFPGGSVAISVNAMTKLAALAALTGSLWAAAPRFELRDTGGALHTQQEWRNNKAVLVFFIMTDCPLSNGTYRK